MEKNMDNEMEAGFMVSIVGVLKVTVTFGVPRALGGMA